MNEYTYVPTRLNTLPTSHVLSCDFVVLDGAHIAAAYERGDGRTFLLTQEITPQGPHSLVWEPVGSTLYACGGVSALFAERLLGTSPGEAFRYSRRLYRRLLPNEVADLVTGVFFRYNDGLRRAWGGE